MNTLITKINNLRTPGKITLIAIDGRCAAGKTTLGEHLKKELGCVIFHADDYFLRIEQRTDERLNEPGGNMDRERLYEEIIKPICDMNRGSGCINRTLTYRPFICKDMCVGEPVTTALSDVVVIEGAYSCHPDLWDYYDYHIFMDIDTDLQLERIKLRNPDKLDAFINKWIPMEERYIEEFGIDKKCEMLI